MAIDDSKDYTIDPAENDEIYKEAGSFSGAGFDGDNACGEEMQEDEGGGFDGGQDSSDAFGGNEACFQDSIGEDPYDGGGDAGEETFGHSDEAVQADDGNNEYADIAENTSDSIDVDDNTYIDMDDESSLGAEPAMDEEDFSQYDDEEEFEMDQDSQINKAVPSTKEGREEAHKNNAMFLNRNKILVAVAGVMVVFVIFFSIIMPSLKPKGAKGKGDFEKASSSSLPDFISTIPSVQAKIPQKETEDFSEYDEYGELDALLPDPTAPAADAYTPGYTYSYNTGPVYANVEEIDSNADPQQVAFVDIPFAESRTAANLNSQIAADALAALNKAAESEEAERLASTWLPYRPADTGVPQAAKSSDSSQSGTGLGGLTAPAGSGGQGIDSAQLLASVLANSSGQNVDTYKRLNRQDDKNNFRSSDSGGNYTYNGSNALWKGTIIPAVLETAINTDLPGVVIATVTENVYSSLDGKYLLIPQGSKVFAEYNSSVSYNQSRVQIAWNTLIRPDGLEVDLGKVDGVDPQGHAGVTGSVSKHPFEYAKAFGLIALITILNTKAQNQLSKANDGLTNNYFTNTGEAVYEEASKLGDQMIQNALDIQPTIKIKSGQTVNLITNVTMVLPPLVPDTPTQKYVRSH